jgi:hypothetical protein
MLPLLLAMGTVLFAVIAYALFSPDPADLDGAGEEHEPLT